MDRSELATLDVVKAEWPATSDKACIVCRFFGGVRSFIYGVYVLDLDIKSDSEVDTNTNPSLEPFLKLDESFPHPMAFALFQSKLFMFGGCRVGVQKVEWGSFVFEYDILQTATKNIVLKNEQVKVLAPMHSPKDLPIAAIVDGKVCVYSNLLSAKFSNFELFDPATESWTKLPELMMAYPEYDKIIVKSHSVQNSKLYISTAIGIYWIDFKESEKIWRKLCGLRRFPFDGTGGSLMFDNLCFSSNCAYFISPMTAFHSPLPLFFHKPRNADDDCESDSDDGFAYCCPGSGDVEIPFCGDAATICIGQNRFCTIKCAFRPKQLEDNSDPPYLILETFEAYDVQSRKRLREGQCWSLDYSHLIWRRHHKLEEGYDQRLVIKDVKPFKYLLTGCPCYMAAVVGSFAM